MIPGSIPFGCWNPRNPRSVRHRHRRTTSVRLRAGRCPQSMRSGWCLPWIDVCPASASSQDVCPVEAWYVPAEHAVWLVPAVDRRSVRHRHRRRTSGRWRAGRCLQSMRSGWCLPWRRRRQRRRRTSVRLRAGRCPRRMRSGIGLPSGAPT